MKHLKNFELTSEYNSFVNSNEFIMPNVTYIKDDDRVYYHALVARNNAITYQADSKLSETTSTGLNSGLHVNAFNSPMVSHEFADGIGTITFEEDVTSIGSYAFSNCKGLTSIVIPDGVTSIGSSAFYACSGLTSIVIPDSITSIGSRAFYQCYGLKSIVIPDGVTSIGSEAFVNCTKLTSINIPDGVTSIAYGAFGFCSGLTSIVIPDSVTSIGKDAFQSCSGLTSIVIPDGVTSIGDSTFEKCSGLTSIVIPDSVTSIGDYAFWNCTGLASIVIPDSVTKIGQGAFLNCSGLKSINIPESVRTIGNSAFNGCSGALILNCNVPSDDQPTGGTFYKSAFTSVEIGPQVKNIGDHAFYQSESLTSLTLSSGVTRIGDSAFYNCSKLTGELVIPDSVTSIGPGAFSNCKGLTSIVIPDSVKTIGSHTFSYCYSLTSINIPDGVTRISNNAFQSCSSLTSINIPDGVTYIGSDAFYGCSSLSSIVVSSGNTKYDSRENCNCLIETATNRLIKGSNNSFIPDSVTSIGPGAFSGCSGLTSINIPDGVTSIGEYAFSSCKGLTSINIPDGVTSIGKGAFAYCSGLTEITIPDSVTTIGEYAFDSCSGLTSVTCHATTAPTIYRNTFAWVKSNGILYYPSGSDYSSWLSTGSQYLGYYSWIGMELATEDVVLTCTYDIANTSSITKLCSYSSTIKTMTIDGVEVTPTTGYTFTTTGKHNVVYNMKVYSMIKNMFSNCTSLTSIVIPHSVTSIGSNAFAGCNNLTSVTCHATTAPTIGDYNTFYDVKSNGILYVPVGSDYSSWMSTDYYYLGYYRWTLQEMYVPTECTSLTITANDVTGRATSTTIHYTAVTNGVHSINGNPITGVIITGTTTSAEFPQNTSETDTVQRTITFEYMGKTASTTITQGVWVNQNYTVDLNDQWQLSSEIPNPDSAAYDGVYESFSNKGVDDSAAFMYIDIVGYENFKFYVRSDAESSYDYVEVSNLDCKLEGDTNDEGYDYNEGYDEGYDYNEGYDEGYDYNEGYEPVNCIKYSTQGSQNSGTAIRNYTLVEFTGIDGGEHRITIKYRKDGSAADGTDRGYVLIPYNQDTNDEGYDYNEGYDEGYDYNEGYDEGYDEGYYE